MSYKQFALRLNQMLDEIDVPQKADERVEAFAKLIKAPKFKAEAFLNGTTIPEPPVLELLATEFEVSVDWLLGKQN